MRVISVVGARPQFVKLAPVAQAMQGRAEHIVIHTGQHYDDQMSGAFFRDLGIREPDLNLAVGSGKHGEQTAAMLSALEGPFEQMRPDWVLIYGDTNSTLAAAVCAIKLHVPVAHLEAGLRSFNRRMPEEHNRVLSDHAADLCLAPTQSALRQLAHEGLNDRSVYVGDVMADVLYGVRDKNKIEGRKSPFEGAEYYLATLHRPDNTDKEQVLRRIIAGLADLPHPVYLAVHPRLQKMASQFGISLEQGAISPVSPLSYPDLVAAASGAKGIVTDSGGLQKEAFLLRTPCTTVRNETEWVETVDLGWNQLVPESQLGQLAATVDRPRPAETSENPYGTGHAAQLVVDELISRAQSN